MKDLKGSLARAGKQLEGVAKKAKKAKSAEVKLEKRLRVAINAVTDARKASSRKAKAVSKAERKRRLAQARLWRCHNLEVLKAKAKKEVAFDINSLEKKVAAARKRARAKEGAAKLSGKRLKRAQAAEAALNKLQATLEEEPEAEESEEDDEAVAAVASSKSRRDTRGRFASMPHDVRVLVWAQLSRRVSPSAVAANISDAIGALAPEEDAQTHDSLGVLVGARHSTTSAHPIRRII